MVAGPVGVGQALARARPHLRLAGQLQQGAGRKAVPRVQDVVQGALVVPWCWEGGGGWGEGEG